jgi:hypothetical protein
MKFPEGCKPDTKLMLRGKGIQRLDQDWHPKINYQKTGGVVASDEEASKNGTRDPLLRVICLLRAYDKEASESGGTGILGRIAKAAGLAFSRIFGSEKEKINDKEEKAKEESKEDTDDEAEQKKAAQRADESLEL